jgi:hypothetical protein
MESRTAISREALQEYDVQYCLLTPHSVLSRVFNKSTYPLLGATGAVVSFVLLSTRPARPFDAFSLVCTPWFTFGCLSVITFIYATIASSSTVERGYQRMNLSADHHRHRE